MPKSLAKRRLDCDRELTAILNRFELDQDILDNLDEHRLYYEKLGDNDELMIKCYEVFIQGLQAMNDGTEELETVMTTMKSFASSEKQYVVLFNILKAFEQLFWLAAAGACLAIAIMASPVLAMDTYTATVVMTLLCAQLLASIINIMNCFSEYKSFTPINERLTREKDFLTFFSTAKAQSSNVPQPLSPAHRSSHSSNDEQGIDGEHDEQGIDREHDEYDDSAAASYIS